MKLLDEIRKVLAPASLVDEQDIKPEHNLAADLGIDSFGTMEVVIGLENKYNIKIMDKQLHLFETVQDVMDYVQQNAATANG